MKIKTLLHCRKCGWISEPQTQLQMKERGVPWYCDRCEENVTRFVDYEPGEEMEAQKRITRYEW
jgi:uncharacterized Zn finger protein